MMISTRGRYALRVLVDLAEHQGQGYVTLREVAQRQDISEKYLECIVKTLVRSGMVEGLRGKGGGYRLAKAPDQLNIREILLLMEGSLAPVACLDACSKPCDKMASCRTLELWKGLDRVVREYLEGFTVADLMARDQSFDYII